MTIWKFPIPTLHSSFSTELPADARFLSVQLQRGRPVAWFLLDTGAPRVERRFRLYCTGDVAGQHGQSFPTASYLGTFQLDDGELVLHLFEETP